MSSLTNTQINNTYPSLLKLSNSTTGITTTLQSVEDGLGGDTGLKIKEDYIGGSSLIPFPKQDTTTMAYGLGVNNSGLAFPAGSHNVLLGQIFYDRGNITYSAITYAIGTVSSTSDVAEIGIYSSQVTPSGIMWKDRLTSITLSGSEMTTLGIAKKTLPSNLTLEEGGLYYIVYTVTNPTVVTPTVRFGSHFMGNVITQFASMLAGFVTNTLGTVMPSLQKLGVNTGSGSVVTTISGPLSSTYVPATFVGTTSTTSAPTFGFVLHPVN